MLRKRRLTPIVALIEAWGPLPDLGRWGQMNARGLLCVKMLLLEPPDDGGGKGDCGDEVFDVAVEALPDQIHGCRDGAGDSSCRLESAKRKRQIPACRAAGAAMNLDAG